MQLAHIPVLLVGNIPVIQTADKLNSIRELRRYSEFLTKLFPFVEIIQVEKICWGRVKVIQILLILILVSSDRRQQKLVQVPVGGQYRHLGFSLRIRLPASSDVIFVASSIGACTSHRP